MKKRTETAAPVRPMKGSWLIQRLKAPTGYINPFAFGGGKRNGGLSDDAVDLVKDIFSFDYMGSAEFEFGALPESLQRIAKDSDKYAKGVVSVPLREVAVPRHTSILTDPEVGDTKNVYIICRKDDTDEVVRRILGWAKDGVGEFKEQPHLSASLRPGRDWDTETCGWLELDNDFFFFTDEGMWEKTAALFSIGGP
jgi:hypothetical protein